MSPLYGLNPLPLRLDGTDVIQLIMDVPDIGAGVRERLELLRNLAGLPPVMALKSTGLVGRWSERWCEGHTGVSTCSFEAGHTGNCKQED